MKNTDSGRSWPQG